MVICFICAKVYFTGHLGLELPYFFHRPLNPPVLLKRAQNFSHDLLLMDLYSYTKEGIFSFET
jgi:hypothetical protein